MATILRTRNAALGHGSLNRGRYSNAALDAALTRVDEKDPTECPYCHALIAPQRPDAAPSVRNAGPALMPLLVVVGALVAMGMFAGFFMFRTSAPQPPPVVSAPVVPRPSPAPPPAPVPPSPVKEVLRFGEAGTNPGQLDSPSHLAVASDGSVVIAESRSGRLQRFGADGVYQAALVMPPDKLTKQNGIFGLATDASGKVYVNRVGDILVYDAATFAAVRTIAGDYPDRYFHGGLAVDGTGNVYSLTDRMGDVDLVSTSPAGKVLSRHRVSATGVAVDGVGKVFLLHRDGLEVQDAKGAVLSKVGGVRGSSLAFDGKGHVFVATGSTVEVLSPEGTKVLSLPVKADKVALDRAGRLYALERSSVGVYEVTFP
jgi:sugar lactone lactonase YvrE